MDQLRRNKQIDYLESMGEKENSLMDYGQRYLIMVNGKAKDIVHCAETAIMLLNTEYKNINVFIKSTK